MYLYIAIYLPVMGHMALGNLNDVYLRRERCQAQESKQLLVRTFFSNFCSEERVDMGIQATSSFVDNSCQDSEPLTRP